MADQPISTHQPSAITPEAPPVPASPRRKNKPGAGRPRLEINWQQFDAMCFSHSTLQEIADFFQCSPDTIERAVKREFRQNFAEIYRQKSAKGKISLRRTMWDSALRRHDSRIMVWLSKQHLGMREGIDVNATVTSNPIPPEIEAKDRDTIEREIEEFFAGLDFSKRLRDHDAFAARLEAKSRREGLARSGSALSPEVQPGPATASEGSGWPTRKDLAVQNAAEVGERKG